MATLLVSVFLLLLVAWIIDLFTQTVVVPVVASAVATWLILRILGLDGLAAWLAALPIFAAVVGTQYWVWRSMLLPWLTSRIAPDRYHCEKTRLRGAQGEVVEVDGRVFVRVHDELYPAEPMPSVGCVVRVDDVEDGVVRVRVISEGE